MSQRVDPKVEEALDDMREAKELGVALTEESKVMKLLQEYAQGWHNIASLWLEKGYADQAKAARDLAAKAEALLAEAARLEQLTLEEEQALQREIRALLGGAPPAPPTSHASVNS